MQSWKLRLLMAFTMVAVVLAVSMPAMAKDIEVTCEAEDGFCDTTVTVDSQVQDIGSEPQVDVIEEPVIEGSDEECFPFCGLEWWPY